MPESTIELKGIRVNNLKGIDVTIPRRKLVVITGLSGSGKSSLAFDTLYAEGQRRYVQSLSAYARQFVVRLPKPDLDSASGIPPSIMIAQHVNTRNSMSTVGTLTEVYSYIRLLYARIGHIEDPETGLELKSSTVEDVVNYIVAQAGRRVMLTAPVTEQLTAELEQAQETRDDGDKPKRRRRPTVADGQLARSIVLDRLAQSGYSRVYIGGEIVPIDTPEARIQVAQAKGDIELLVDRFQPKDEPDFQARCANSVETAYLEGAEHCRVYVYASPEAQPTVRDFSSRILYSKGVFPPVTPELFSFSSPLGACPTCQGYGYCKGISEELVIPNQELSVYDDAVVCWKGPSMHVLRDEFIAAAGPLGFPIHRPYRALTPAERDMLWDGVPGAMGLNGFFLKAQQSLHKIFSRVLIGRYSGRSVCRDCHGTRLIPEAQYVKVGGKSVGDLISLQLNELLEFFRHLVLSDRDREASRRLLLEITTRLGYLLDVGLDYLTLDRPGPTLSGGETQRINLATALGSSLVGSLYILDEPSVGLHSADTQRLISVLKRLRDQGNTVVVVEHDDAIIRAADYVIDLGPKAGSEGGHVQFAGPASELLEAKNSLTAEYITGRKRLPLPKTHRPTTRAIELSGIHMHNVQDAQAIFPLQAMTVVSGVSGSGKSTLVQEVLYPLVKHLTERPATTQEAESLGEQAVEDISQELPYADSVAHCHLPPNALAGAEYVDQNALTRSLRSTPITYMGAFDFLRALYAKQPAAIEQNMGYRAFSFNDSLGACPACGGTGREVVEMQFMADIDLECELCHGMRYKPEVLSVCYRGKSIADVLQMTIDDALAFFSEDTSDAQLSPVVEALRLMHQVGMGYITLGQPTSTLSGGEAQRLKIASHLKEGPSSRPLLFCFDEPTTGLHTHDVGVLLQALRTLVDRGHTLVVVEHNLDVIAQADWLIDMGPGGGNRGGRVVAMGRPEEVAQCAQSLTGHFLKEKFAAYGPRA